MSNPYHQCFGGFMLCIYFGNKACPRRGTSCLPMVGGSLWELWLFPPLKLVTMI